MKEMNYIDWRLEAYLGLPLPGNDFLSKIGEGSVDVLDSGPWYRKSAKQMFPLCFILLLHQITNDYSGHSRWTPSSWI